MKTIENLQKALDSMPNEFSSYEFCEKAREFGITDYEIEQKVCSNFLREKTDRQSVRRWKKKGTFNYSPDQLTTAIQFLKKQGYKIFKEELQLKEL